ncbi:MAG: hypothetical protein NVS3B21_27950 [Acidimicrobiales bacterium]
MTTTDATDGEMPNGGECWCCGQNASLGQTVRLGNHPEVELCLRCARFVAKRAGEIEDQQRPGFAVKVREAMRHVRRTVVQRGWHNTPILGGALRWIGRHTP